MENKIIHMVHLSCSAHSLWYMLEDLQLLGCWSVIRKLKFLNCDQDQTINELTITRLNDDEELLQPYPQQ